MKAINVQKTLYYLFTISKYRTFHRSQEVDYAVAIIRSLKTGKYLGQAIFYEEEDTNVEIQIGVEGLTPGEHGLHIHEFGDLRLNGKMMGGHFNPTKLTDRQIQKDNIGDLGNIYANKKGAVFKTNLINERIALRGEFSRKGFNGHRGPDDFTSQPSGNSGKKMAANNSNSQH